MNTTLNTDQLRTRDDALRALSQFLCDFEVFQEQVDLRRAEAALAALQERTAGFFPALHSAIARHDTTETSATDTALAALRDGIDCLEQAVRHILNGRGAGFVLAFLESRQDLQRALTTLYGVRRAFPLLQAYFVTAEALIDVDVLDTPAADNTTATGLMTLPATATHQTASLYVPESYSPSRAWPLIVCLHGGHGHGNEYLWTWLRLARSARALLLAPKSHGPTWSMLNPRLDIHSIHAMLDAVRTKWRVDDSRVFLSGLSDGGTFSYLLGITGGSLFAGIAPVAGVLPEMADPFLRARQGREVPLFIVHGAQDFIFDVRGVRSTTALLEKLGYRITYTELPDWGHAFPYHINETLVLPWFRGLGL